MVAVRAVGQERQTVRWSYHTKSKANVTLVHEGGQLRSKCRYWSHWSPLAAFRNATGTITKTSVATYTYSHTQRFIYIYIFRMVQWSSLCDGYFILADNNNNIYIQMLFLRSTQTLPQRRNTQTTAVPPKQNIAKTQTITSKYALLSIVWKIRCVSNAVTAWSTMECNQPTAWTTNRSLLVASPARAF